MNPIHIHLMTNHVPVLGTIFGCLLIIYSLIRNKEELRRLALGVFLIVALITPVVFFSGDKSQDALQKVVGISKESIKSHDEAAEISFACMELLGAFAFLQLLLYFFPSTAKLRSKAAIFTAILSAFAFAWVAYTANLGGKIQHGKELNPSLEINP
jgi:hypothetical protein